MRISNMMINIDVRDEAIVYCILGAKIDDWASDVSGSAAKMTLELTDRERDGKVYKLTPDDFRHGLAKMAHNSPKHFANLLSNNYDCITGDVLIQYAAFGKLIYG